MYSEPPPPEATYINYVRIENKRAAAAGAWITLRLNQAAEVAGYLWP